SHSGHESLKNHEEGEEHREDVRITASQYKVAPNQSATREEDRHRVEQWTDGSVEQCALAPRKCRLLDQDVRCSNGPALLAVHAQKLRNLEILAQSLAQVDTGVDKGLAGLANTL